MATAPAKPRRRVLRYSLRSLLIVVTILALGFGYISERASRQRKAVEMVHKFRGDVVYRHQTKQQEPWAPAWLRKALGDDYFVTVTRVYLSPPINDEGLAVVPVNAPGDDDIRLLAGLPELEHLGLFWPTITDAGFRRLGSLTRLKGLLLDGSAVSDGSLEVIARFSQLEYLIIYDTCIADQGLKHLSNLKNLVILHMHDTSVGDEGIAHLAELVNLENLTLSGTCVTDAGLASLGGLPKLAYLDLSRTEVTGSGFLSWPTANALISVGANDSKFTGAGMAYLNRCQGLERLELGGTNVDLDSLDGMTSLKFLRITRLTPAALKHIEKMTKIEWLEVYEDELDDADLEVLRSLPKLQTFGIGGRQFDRTEIGLARSARGLLNPEFDEISSSAGAASATQD